MLDDDALAARRRDLPIPAGAPAATRGYRRLWDNEVLQADGGCDFSSFVPPPTATAPVTRPLCRMSNAAALPT